jgi:hypothetical protein
MYELLDAIINQQDQGISSMTNLIKMPSINSGNPPNLNDLCWDPTKVGIGM